MGEVKIPDQEIRSQEAVRLGQNIRQLRQAHGWSQDELASRTNNLTQAHISRIERGVREIRMQTVLALVVALECEPNELFEGLY